jgi:hypothetical protein
MLALSLPRFKTKKELKMRYRKIAIKKESVDLEYEDSNAAGTFDVMSLKAKDEPAPEFHQAMENFKPIFIRLCELNESDKAKIIITGVHLSYHGDNNRMGIVISGYKKLVNYVGIVTMNSPCMLEREDKANPKKDIPDDLTDCFDELWKQADKFLKGYRAQLSIDLKKDSNEEKKSNSESNPETKPEKKTESERKLNPQPKKNKTKAKTEKPVKSGKKNG